MKITVILLTWIAFFTSCSKWIGPGKLEQSASFNIIAQASAGKNVLITIPGSARSSGKGDYREMISHTYKKDGYTVEKSYYDGRKFVWGYYIYQNTTNPYESYDIQGFTGRSKYTIGSYQPSIASGFQYQLLLVNPVPVDYTSTTDFSLSLTCSLPGKTYYYRVAKVYRAFKCSDSQLCSSTYCPSIPLCSGNWDGDGYIEDISAWTAAVCLP